MNRDEDKKRMLSFWWWSYIPGRQHGRRGISEVLVLLQSYCLIIQMLNDKRVILAKTGVFSGNYYLLWRLLWDHQKTWVLCLEIWAAGDKKIYDFIGKSNRGVICGRGREERDEKSEDVILSFKSCLCFIFSFYTNKTRCFCPSLEHSMISLDVWSVEGQREWQNTDFHMKCLFHEPGEPTSIGEKTLLHLLFCPTYPGCIINHTA